MCPAAIQRIFVTCSLWVSFAWGASLSAGPADLSTDQTVRQEQSLADSWLQTAFTGSTLQPPVSFVYNDISSDTFLPGWHFIQTKAKLDSNRTLWTLVYTEPNDGPLKVTCMATEYQDYPAVEWVVYFDNIGAADTPIIENIQALATTMSCSAVADTAGVNEFTLNYAQGDTGSPSDFQPMQTRLNRNASVSLAPNKGRSSDTTMPFFNIEQPDHTGRIIAIGWTGQWKASFTRDNGKNLNIRAGMERTHLRLHPGEKIRTPAILMTFWAGDRIHAQNAFRRLIREHYSPLQNGKPVNLPLCMSVHGTYSFEATAESNLKDFILKLKQNQCPVEYIWIDAGWYNLNGCKSWVNVGTWEPDPARYPNGMKPVVDYAHASGYKFVLWFEPERVTQGSWLWTHHPEWIFRQGNDWPLLNLGNPDCLAWVKTIFGDMIGNWGVDVYRQDFNVFPLSAWRNGEAADRQGIHEIKHIMGLYEFWDYLLNRYPGLIIDNCASGGRRIDFETLRRSLVLWRDDHCWVSDSEQCINYGISMWLPWTGRGSVSTAPYDVRSGMGSFMSLAYNVNDSSIWTPANIAINQFKTVRHLFQGDFYPLTPYSLAKDVWIGWQYDRPEIGQGLLQAFRRADSTVVEMVFRLEGLDPKAFYTVTNLDGDVTTKSGSELMNPGLKVNLPTAPGSVLIVYSKK